MTSRHIQRFTFATAVIASATLAACDNGPPPALDVSSVAAPKNIATGGDALIKVVLPEGAKASKVSLSVNGAAVKTDLRAGAAGPALLGKVSGLNDGANKIVALYNGKEAGSVTVENYAAAGPIFSGPHQTPFFCTTETYELPVTGGTLGKATDADCNAPSRVDYVYKSTDGKFKPLPDPKTVPADVASTTTIDKKTVKYIVRVQRGVADRAIYQIAMLHDPNTDKPVDIWTRPAGWNGRLVYTYGGGYGAAFNQGSSDGGVFNDILLSHGYAVASSTLNVGRNNGNDIISAETTLAVKEKFIETAGPVAYTIGWGASGGAMQQHHITQNYPGLLDGILPSAASPDATTRIGFVTDCSLLNRYFEGASDKFTDEQKTAVAGFANWKACTGAPDFKGSAWIKSGFSPGWVDPGFCDKAVPESARYNSVSNPKGARCTTYEDMVNVVGRDADGKARRGIDSVGIQYGLGAYKDGKITAAQFVDLNEKVGGYDIDANWQAGRTQGSAEALRLMYETGRINQGGGGLAYTPTIDLRTYTDPWDFHDRVRSLETKIRMLATNGDVKNRVWLLFPGNSPLPPDKYHEIGLAKMEEWLSKISTDTAAGTYRDKVIRNKPADLKEGCFDEEGTFTEEEMAFGVANKCNAMFPPHGDARMVAGGTPANDIMKCELKAVDAADYPSSMSAALLGRLKKAFPDGVCDWSKPGVGQVKQVGVWLKYSGDGKYAPMP